MKLDSGSPYKIYHSIDIKSIQHRLKTIDPSVWDKDQSRQAYNHGPHNKTKNLIVQHCRGEPEVDKEFYDMFPQYKTGKIPVSSHMFIIPTEEEFYKDIKEIKEIYVDEELNQLTQSIVSDLEKQFNGVSGSVIYARLPAGEKIHAHKDPGYYLSVIHRLHIPIFTNDKCLFQIDNTIFNMEEGMLYEIDNLLMHQVQNNGDAERIHLIVDIIPNIVYNR